MGKRNQIIEAYNEIKTVCQNDEFEEIMKKYKNKKKIMKTDFSDFRWSREDEKPWKTSLFWALERYKDIQEDIKKEKGILKEIKNTDTLDRSQKKAFNMEIDGRIEKLKKIPLKWLASAIIAE